MAEYFQELLNYIPKEVSLTVLIVIFITEATKDLMSKLEYVLEAKTGKQIKFFDHTKIIFVIFWSLIGCICLAWAGIFPWKLIPLYLIGMIGASTVLYEVVIKKIGKMIEQRDEKSL